jgi:hypothetical protein
MATTFDQQLHRRGHPAPKGMSGADRGADRAADCEPAHWRAWPAERERRRRRVASSSQNPWQGPSRWRSDHWARSSCPRSPSELRTGQVEDGGLSEAFDDRRTAWIA